MKKITALLLFSFTASFVFAQTVPKEYYDLIKKAEAKHKDGKYSKAAKTYSSAFKVNGWKGFSADRYNAACDWAMINKPDSAFPHLQRIAEKMHYSNFDLLSGEEYLQSLHMDPRWQPLLELVKRNKEFELPYGWERAGTKASSYLMETDTGVVKDGRSAATIKSVDPEINGNGTVMQHFSPGKFLGKRIRMTGFLKTKEVTGKAFFWLRVAQKNPEKLLCFDNMKNGIKDRSIVGTTDWKKYELVLDVPYNASEIGFGAQLDGTGQIWFDNINFEIVDKNVPVTGREDARDEPINLDFEK